MARLTVRVTPGARADAILGWREGVLRVRVTARPERGKANEAVCRLVANHLGVPAGAVAVRHGGASREKVLEIDGLTDAEVRARLNAPLL